MNRMLVALVMCASGLSAQASKDGAPGEVAFYLRTAGLYDSNLDHDPVGRAAYGGVLAAGLTARDRASRPRVEVAYEAAAHRYSAPSRLERVSHHGEITFTARPARALAFSTEAEVSLRGSSEDRTGGHEFVGAEQLELRLTRATALRLTGAYRLRQYPDPQDVGRDARNRYAELELRQRVGSGIRMTMGGRVERHRADLARSSYNRTTWALGLETASARRVQLALELTYRVQRDPDRLVEVGGRDLPRRDRRFEPEAALTVRPWRSLDVMLGYSLDLRRSNDPDKVYDAHVVSLVLTRWL